MYLRLIIEDTEEEANPVARSKAYILVLGMGNVRRWDKVDGVNPGS